MIGIQNPTDALSRLDDDEKSALDSIEGYRGPVNVVNTAGLNTLILSGRLRKDHPSYDRVKRIRRWVCHEVLPSIYATGGYQLRPAPEAQPPSPVNMLKVMLAIAERQERQDRELAEVRAVAATASAKADAAFEAVAGTADQMTIMGFCNLKGIRLDPEEQAILGGKLSKQCRAVGIDLPHVINRTYGKLNLYPIEILEKWYAGRSAPSFVP